MRPTRRVAVMGAGSWGTALAIMAARADHEVLLWSRDERHVNEINNSRLNPKYLSSTRIPDNVCATTDVAESLCDSSIVLLAVPSHATRHLLNMMTPHLQRTSIVVSVAKGIEINSGQRISELVHDILGSSFFQRFVCLSGPSFAHEVVEGQPTAVVAASTDEEAAQSIQRELSFGNLRIYTNSDVVGTELGGAVKNVMAIAAGMTSGLGLGSNSIAALITRGLTEMTRFVLRRGGQFETMVGLAGLGDLVLTCTGRLSRNRFVGEELGKGRTLEQILSGMNEVAEGIKTSRAVKRLADESGIEMPITNEVVAVLYEGKSARDAVHELMSRPLRAER